MKKKIILIKASMLKLTPQPYLYLPYVTDCRPQSKNYCMPCFALIQTLSSPLFLPIVNCPEGGWLKIATFGCFPSSPLSLVAAENSCNLPDLQQLIFQADYYLTSPLLSLLRP